MVIPPLLADLLAASGPSGHEEPAASVWRDAASTFAEVTRDPVGNSYAHVGPGDRPTLALVGHIDEIGIAVTHIEESGLLAYTVVGGFTPEALFAQRVTIAGRNGPVRGVVGRRMLPPNERRDRPRLDHADLHIDIGAASRDEAAALVRPGDAGVWDGPLLELPNGRISSKALDNRLGAYIALEAARRIGEAGGAWQPVAVAAVAEEVGYFGSRTAAYSLNPGAAIAIDVTYTTDGPGGDPRRVGKVELGSGVAISRGPMLNARVFDLLVEAAEAETIPHSFEIYTSDTMTDADAVNVSRAGIPTGLLSIPLRYMHSPVELASLEDIESVIRLVTAFGTRLAADESFLR